MSGDYAGNFPKRFKPSTLTTIDPLHMCYKTCTHNSIILHYVTRIGKHFSEKWYQLFSGFSECGSVRQGPLLVSNRQHDNRMSFGTSSKSSGSVRQEALFVGNREYHSADNKMSCGTSGSVKQEPLFVSNRNGKHHSAESRKSGGNNCKSSGKMTVIHMYWCVFFILTYLLGESDAVQQDSGELYKVDNPVSDHSVVPPVNNNKNNMELQFDKAGFPLANEGNQSDWPNASETTTSTAKTENPNDVTVRALEFGINAVLTNIVVMLGTIGNSLTIIILTRRAMRSSTNIYLSALAVWDIVVLNCTALLIGLPAIPEFMVYRYYVHPYVISYVYPIALIAQTATIWLTVSFTVERYIAVCHPLKAARMCTIKRAKIVIYGVSIGATLYNIPRWFEYTAVKFVNPDLGNQTITLVSQTSFVQNPWYTQIYFSWLYVPIMCIIPLATLSILNTCLVMAVRRSQKQRKDMNVRQSRENNVTIMLASVVVVFIMCQVPALVYNLAYAIDREYVEQRSFGYRVLSVMRNFLVAFNSAINFLLYCALGQKFRRIFLHTFCKKCINDTYMPMSGIHQHTSQFQVNSHHQGARQYYANNHAMMVRNRGLTDGHTTSSSTTQTTLGTNSFQESTLIDPGTSPRHHPVEAREVRTYTAPRNNKKRVTSPGHVGPMTSSVVDSDTEGYDVALEHLLTSSEKSDASLTGAFNQQPRNKLYGIKNTVTVQ